MIPKGQRLFVNWKEQFKVRVNSGPHSPFSKTKHEIVKLMVMQAILKKHKNRNKQLVYSEYDIGNGKIADIYHQYDKNYIGYEIQEKITREWTKKTIDKYEEVGFSLVIIPLNKTSNNLIKLQEQIEKFII